MNLLSNGISWYDDEIGCFPDNLSRKTADFDEKKGLDQTQLFKYGMVSGRQKRGTQKVTSQYDNGDSKFYFGLMYSGGSFLRFSISSSKEG
jgi:hypothetical protein